MGSVTEMKEITLDVNYSDLEILHKVETNCGTVHVHVAVSLEIPRGTKLLPLSITYNPRDPCSYYFHPLRESPATRSSFLW